MKRFASALALATAVFLPAAATPAAAQAPIHVSAHASFATVTPGGFQDVDCLVENLTDEPLLVRITADVTYADGDVQTFRFNQPPTLIDPNGAFLLSIGFAVPSDAALGTATFTCTAQALGVAGGYRESATATFEVVAA